MTGFEFHEASCNVASKYSQRVADTTESEIRVTFIDRAVNDSIADHMYDRLHGGYTIENAIKYCEANLNIRGIVVLNVGTSYQGDVVVYQKGSTGGSEERIVGWVLYSKKMPSRDSPYLHIQRVR